MIWYILLVLLGIGLITFTLIKTKNQRLIVLHLCMVGMALCFEIFVTVILKGYAFHPHIFKEEFIDNILGALISDALIVSALAMTLVGLRLKFIWYLVFTAFLFGVESLFVKLGIYEQYWWRSYYTSAGLLLFFWIAGKWGRWLRSPAESFIYYIALYFSTCAPIVIIQYVLSAFGVFYYRLGLIEPLQRESGIIRIALTYLLFGIVLVLMIAFKLNWQFKLLLIIGLYIMEFILVRLSILHVPNIWFYILYATATNIGGYIIVLFLERILRYGKFSIKPQ